MSSNNFQLDAHKNITTRHQNGLVTAAGYTNCSVKMTSPTIMMLFSVVFDGDSIQASTGRVGNVCLGYTQLAPQLASHVGNCNAIRQATDK